MIYVPDTSYSCYVVINEETIRAYENVPQQNIDVDYRDYYINSNYLYQDGTQSFSRYSTLPVCLNSDLITDDVYYRNDLDSILIVFLILSIFCIFLPIKLLSKLFKRGNL